MRNIRVVIDQMIECIPSDQTDFIEDLKACKHDARFRAPEDNVIWFKTHDVLREYLELGHPEEDWQFELISIFSTVPVDVIKKNIAEFNK